MQKMLKEAMFQRTWVAHPILFALYPVIQLYALNSIEIPFSDAARALLAALLGAAGLLMLLGWLLRDWHRAGLVVSLVVVLFFSFRHILTLLTDNLHLAVAANVFMALWMTVLILGVWALIRVVRSVPGSLTVILNVIGAAALLMAVVPLVEATWKNTFNPLDELISWDKSFSTAPTAAPSDPPDIYYIILDGFAREDVLRDIYGIEKPEFTSYLKQQGFQIAEESRSNYQITLQSISSSLNYHYLQDMLEIDPQAISYLALEHLIENNHAAAFLKGRGYTFVMVTTGYKSTRVESADVVAEAGRGDTFTSFEASLLFNTMLAPWMDAITAPMHRTKNLEAFALVAEQARQPGPKFVFAHIMVPHPPFLFDAEGRAVLNSTVNGRAGRVAGEADLPDGNRGFATWKDAYRDGYRQQLIFTSRMAQEMIATILADSRTPPVIIVQGDHGPDTYMDWSNVEKSCLRERFSILNALYLPGAPAMQVPADLTPVNTFRLVFNQYFGADFPLEENRSYAFALPNYYDWVDVTGKLDQCPGR